MLHVIIPTYNGAVEVERCISYLGIQELSDSKFNVVVVDDASGEPQHRDVCDRYCARFGYTLVRNTQNMKAPYTIKQGIEASGAAEDDIIFLLDGDDLLPPWALGRIDAYYERYPQIWLTYGNYQPYPNGWTTEAPASEYPTLVRWERTFRTDGAMRFNHPITFRRFLWDQLSDADLQDDEGVWFTNGYDQVIMMPMLEMAAPDHYAMLDEVLYYYNSENPISEWRLIAQDRLTPRASQVLARPQKPQLIR